MPLSPADKKKVIQTFATVAGDTGSPEVQVALITKRIDKLTEHLKKHAHDVHSRRGLLTMISKRRRIINFLAKKDEKRYKEVIKKLELPK